MAAFILIHGIRVAKDFTPETFGRLTAIGHAFMVGRRSYQVFECNCGNAIVARVGDVKRGNTQSCGCYRKEVASERTVARNTKHGLHKHELYGTWASIIQRCYDPKHQAYPNYGGRGITVCDRWRESFASFLSDMGERPGGCTVDRIDNSKGYEPNNCRWATAQEQHNNTRSNRLLTFNGKTQTVSQWERELGFPVRLIHNRLRLGWPVERALSKPARPRKQRAL